MDAKTKVALVLFVIATLVITSCKKKEPPIVQMKVAKCTHAVGLCNLCMFIAYENQTAKEDHVQIKLVNIPNWADHPAALQSGTVDFSVTPFTNVIAAYANGAPIKIVAGSGINGLYVLGSRDIKTASDLRGKKIGTFRCDTLEMLLYNYLKKNNMSYNDVKVVYFTDGFELISAFSNNAVDAMTHVEPYATQAVEKHSANILAIGQTVWGSDHPDCVLTASDRIIREDPNLVKAVIAGMLKAELFIEENLDKSIDKVVGIYYKAEREDIMKAANSQPPGVDIRNKKSFMLERFKDLKELNYIKRDPDPGVMDFRFLEEAIRENPQIYEKLKVKSL